MAKVILPSLIVGGLVVGGLASAILLTGPAPASAAEVSGRTTFDALQRSGVPTGYMRFRGGRGGFAGGGGRGFGGGGLGGGGLGGGRGFGGGGFGRQGFAGRGFGGGGYRRGGIGGGAVLGGLAAGALLGGALATQSQGGYYGYGGQPGYGYGYGAQPGYGYGYQVQPGYGYGVQPVYEVQSEDPRNSVAYCVQRFRSYDRASGTYLGNDGLRHACP